jgi:hypothetical protein
MALSKSGVIAISVTFALLSIVLFCAFCAFCLSFTARESLDSSWDIPDFPGDLEEVVLPGDREEVVLPGDRKDVVLQVERTDMYTVGQRIESSTDVVRDRKRAYRRGKEIAMRTYLNKVLRILFILFGLLTIILSVVLDNSYNDQPRRFIPFGILAPFTIFFGFLASGWFPRIPLRFIAFLKRHRFLRHVIPCSPWHDNVLTDFSGMICTLKPMELAEDTSQLPQVLQNFLYGDVECPQGAVVTQSALEPESSVFQDVPTSTPQSSDFQEVSTLTPQSSDFQEAQSIQKPEDISETLPPHLTCTGRNLRAGPCCFRIFQTSQAPVEVQQAIVQVDHSSTFLVSDHGRILTFQGPKINGFPLEVEVFKNPLSRDSFYLSCTFRNMKTRRMYLNTRRLHNLTQNMLRWVEKPYPIVVDESDSILHCMPIQDILWAFTKSLYTLKIFHVQDRFLGCLSWEGVQQYALLAFIAVTSLSGLIPLLSDVRSLYFLFFVVPIVAYILFLATGHLVTYYFKSLLCPMFIKVRGFKKLYKCNSFFIWCNEFRKQRVVNPAYFLIDQEYANSILEDGESCFDVYGSVETPDSSPQDQSPITMTCQGWPADPLKCQKQHDYRLVVKFDSVQDGCYIDIRLSFYENDDLLDNRYFYGSTKVERLHLIQKLFSYYSDPSFGGYVETIRPSFRSYLAHCPRFLDICKKIITEGKKANITEDTIPTLLIAARKPDSNLIIGDSFLSPTPQVL